jgi:hypothetical protein
MPRLRYLTATLIRLFSLPSNYYDRYRLGAFCPVFWGTLPYITADSPH